MVYSLHMKKIILWVIVLAIIIVGGMKIFGNKSETLPADVSENTVDAGSNVDVNDDHMAPPPATVATKSFTVSGENFSFTPSTITVKKGDMVSITFKNVSGFHDFRLPAFNVATKQFASPGEETVTFTADKTGSFEFYCSVGNHKAMGMKGTLVVQ